MGKRTGAELEDRIAALSARIDAALERSNTWISPPTYKEEAAPAELAQLQAMLTHAEANVTLQAQRCQALEDRLVELEAALVGAREARARAEARVEDALAQANVALDQAERARGQSPAPVDPNLGVAFQEKLLEIERLTRERDSLRSSSVDWRGKAQKYRRERDESTLALSRATSELDELRERDTSSRRKLGELERLVAEQKRELEVAVRRAEHLRQHFGR